jgi:hypothetical protein
MTGTSCFKIVRPGEDSMLIASDLQKRYRTGVSVLLHLTRYSRPNLCNVVRELSKCMDGATYIEMLRVIKFVIDTTNFCLEIHPKDGIVKVEFVRSADNDSDFFIKS